MTCEVAVSGLIRVGRGMRRTTWVKSAFEAAVELKATLCSFVHGLAVHLDADAASIVVKIMMRMR
jgi:hypothetical protein